MAISAGEIEVLMRMRVEGQAQVERATAALREAGVAASSGAGGFNLASVATSFLGNALAQAGLRAWDFGKNLVDASVGAGARLEQLTGISRFLGEKMGYTAGQVDEMAGAIQKSGITGVESRSALIALAQANISLEQAAKLSAVAQNMATISGKGSSETYGLMVRALQTMNPQLLKSAGFTMNLDTSNRDAADALGKTTAELTGQEKKLGFVNAMLAEGAAMSGLYGLSMDYASKQAGSATRAWAELGESIGTMLLPITSVMMKEWYKLGTATRDASKAVAEEFAPLLKTLGDKLKDTIDVAKEFAGALVGITVELYRFTSGALTGLPDWMKVLGGSFIVAAAGVTLFNGALNALVATQAVKAIVWFGAEVKLLMGMIAWNGWAGFALHWEYISTSLLGLMGPVGWTIAAVGSLIAIWVLWGDKISSVLSGPLSSLTSTLSSVLSPLTSFVGAIAEFAVMLGKVALEYLLVGPIRLFIDSLKSETVGYFFKVIEGGFEILKFFGGLLMNIVGRSLSYCAELLTDATAAMDVFLLGMGKMPEVKPPSPDVAKGIEAVGFGLLQAGDIAKQVGTVMGSGIDSAGSAAQQAVVALAAMKKEVAALTGEQRAGILANKEMGLSVDKNAEAMELAEGVVKMFLDTQKDSTAELKKAHTELKKYNEDIDDMNRKLAAAIEPNKKWADEIERATKRVGDATTKNAVAAHEAVLELEELSRKNTMRRVDFEVDAIRRAGENKKLQYDKDIKNYQQTMDAIDAITAERVKAAQEAEAKIFGGSEFQGPMPLIKITVDTLGDKLKSMSSLFSEMSNIAGESFGRVAQAIGTTVSALAMAHEAGKSMKTALSEKNWAGFIAGAAQAVAAMDQATQHTNKAVNAMSGAMAGAKVGAAFGPWGAAIGAVGGAILGMARSASTAHKEIEEADKALKEFAVANYGSLDALHEKADLLGVSFTRFTGHGKKGLEEMKKAADELADKIETIDKASALAVSGFAAITTEMVRPATEVTKRTMDAYEAIQDFNKEIDKTYAKQIAAGEIVKLTADEQERWKNLVIEQNEALGEFEGVVARLKQPLADLGVLAVATFGAALASGKSYAEAMTEVGPALAKLNQAYVDLGLNVEDVALKHLLIQGAVAEANPSLMAAIDGLSGSMQGLEQLGLLNVDTFGAMQRTGMEMYTRLQDAVNLTGGETRDALVPMQGYLHQAQIAAEQLGIPLDDNTQMLIDQSKELGIWKEAGKSASDRVIEGMQALINKVDELITRIVGVSTSIGNIPDRTAYVDVVTRYSSTGSNGEGGGEDGYASGTMGATGSWFKNFGAGTPTVLHGDEAVVRRDQAAAFASEYGGGGSSEDLAAAIAEQLQAFLPKAMARAMREAIQTA